jgi:hypothetical protein
MAAALEMKNPDRQSDAALLGLKYSKERRGAAVCFSVAKLYIAAVIAIYQIVEPGGFGGRA